MQLFINEFDINENIIIINDKEIIKQIRKVLRLKIGSTFFVQRVVDEKVFRYRLQIDHRDDKSIFCTIQEEQSKKLSNILDHKAIIIAMPNKRGKAELIVQKLSEIGIQNIYFWPSERSIITHKNDNKRQRLYKISREAVEQSRGRVLPKIKFVSNITENINNKNIIIFDHNLSSDPSNIGPIPDSTIGLIGPEGGFTDKDYKKFGNSITILGLGDSVLRMETAAIIGGWVFKNQI